MVMIIMKELFNRFCIYYLNHFDKRYYKKIIKDAKNAKFNYEEKKATIISLSYINQIKMNII